LIIDKGVLVTIVERGTRFTVSAQVGSKSADSVTTATIALLLPLKKVVSRGIKLIFI